jgi:ribulose-5-phosphate 4-epimerase/fuculose-1-phosphate aldolase
MFLTNLVSSHTGSMSVRSEDRATISRRGAMLGRLRAEDLMEIAIDEEAPEEAPEDVLVHQMVYRSTDALSVIYARPPATMALALIEDRLSPAAGEGAEYFGSAPVLISQRAINSPDIAQLIARTLRENRIVALRGQGVFARGADLDDAFHMVSLLEEMCRVVQIFRTLSREEQQPAGREREWHEQKNSLSPFRDQSRNQGQQGRRPPARSGPPRQGGNQPPRRSDSPPSRMPTGDRNSTRQPRRGPHRPNP